MARMVKKEGVPDKNADRNPPMGYSGLNVLIQETTNHTTLFQNRSFNHPVERKIIKLQRGIYIIYNL